jgi:glyoxylase-like metal-dependent hydrolase (beta-lactamase superfamily II)/ferredoxin
MALIGLRKPENVEGDFYVDSSCIDCDLCRQIAPGVFRQEGDQSVVYSQPRDESEDLAAMKALVTCPTASIGTVQRRSAKEAVAAYPELVDENVYFCGFASESSYGASSYFIGRPEGNVLVDSPRFAAPLAKKIEEMGGVKLMFLTHRDDVADHDKWVARFGADRVLHRNDITRGTSMVERALEGLEAIALDKELLVIPTPGHTRGHMVLLYRNRYLFTGDHLWWSEDRNSLSASRSVCWYSWTEQTASMERLLEYDFEWVLPGHGRRFHASRASMRQHLENCITRMKQQNRVAS